MRKCPVLLEARSSLVLRMTNWEQEQEEQTGKPGPHQHLHKHATSIRQCNTTTSCKLSCYCCKLCSMSCSHFAKPQALRVY